MFLKPIQLTEDAEELKSMSSNKLIQTYLVGMWRYVANWHKCKINTSNEKIDEHKILYICEAELIVNTVVIVYLSILVLSVPSHLTEFSQVCQSYLSLYYYEAIRL